MNWKLIFQLSVFGLIMAFATVFLIPETFEPFFWVAIFIFSAYVIVQRVRSKYFWHGFFVSLVNCVWITAAHIIFYSTYIASHPNMVKMSQNHPFLPTHPRLAMLIMGPVVGIVCGLILGLLAFIGSLMVKKKVAVQ
jgi:hypothetical protein